MIGGDTFLRKSYKWPATIGKSVQHLNDEEISFEITISLHTFLKSCRKK